MSNGIGEKRKGAVPSSSQIFEIQSVLPNIPALVDQVIQIASV
jgi:hypothetical protein